MSNTRLVRVCYNRLRGFHNPVTVDARYNWCTLVRHLLEDVGYSHVWIKQDPELLEDKLSEIVIAYRNQCKDIDISNLITSTSNPFYFLTWKKWTTAKYLLYHIPFCLKSLVTQVRLNSRKLYFKGKLLSFGGDYCIFCDRLGDMTPEHVLLRCRSLATERAKCSLLSSPSPSHLLVSIGSADVDVIRSLCYFIIHVLKIDSPSS